ncbi:RnfABCDGE type electron transport complex subunit D [Viridibacterium curvum]|uniref:Ion-translocating oxidoreductase complex subunit D n=1 Tax=Viridibacterium curvum TaxID=1101404 RepID=A0ABP9QDF4_9RHOO
MFPSRQNNSPYVRAQTSVTQVMLKVLLALLPAIGTYVWLFGIGVLVQLLLASVTALVAEAAMLKLRGKPTGMFLSDLSAIVTAWLIALAFPSIAPWWVIVLGTAFAIVIAKHLYGGLGQNPFNPAMVAYCVMIVAFPALMSQWPAAGLDNATQLARIFGQSGTIDALTGATPLDALRTGLRESGATVAQTLGGPAFGWAGGKGWEWIAAAYALGGAFLLQQRIITWHIPAAFLGGLAVIAGIAALANGSNFPGPLYHLATGGSMLGAFFILTDPVSGATTPRGKLLFGVGAALLTWIIRSFGAYPDGIAFATLLMNLCVPILDMKTQPPVFGHKNH